MASRARKSTVASIHHGYEKKNVARSPLVVDALLSPPMRNVPAGNTFVDKLYGMVTSTSTRGGGVHQSSHHTWEPRAPRLREPFRGSRRGLTLGGRNLATNRLSASLDGEKNKNKGSPQAVDGTTGPPWPDLWVNMSNLAGPQPSGEEGWKREESGPPPAALARYGFHQPKLSRKRTVRIPTSSRGEPSSPNRGAYNRVQVGTKLTRVRSGKGERTQRVNERYWPKHSVLPGLLQEKETPAHGAVPKDAQLYTAEARRSLPTGWILKKKDSQAQRRTTF